MRANCWMGKQNVEVVDVPDPKILNPRDAIVKITSTAICGSDLHLYNGFIPTMEQGDILGHEFMGEVVEVGRRGEEPQVGDRVVVPFPIACGSVLPVRARQLYSLCENSNPNAWMAEKLWATRRAGIFGYSHMLGGYAGGQAEYARVPFADVGPDQGPRRPAGRAGAVPVRHLPDRLHGRRRSATSSPATSSRSGAAARSGQFAIASACCSAPSGSSRSTASTTGCASPRERAGAETRSTTRRRDVCEALKEMTGGRGPDACIDAVGMEAHRHIGDAARLRPGQAGALMPRPTGRTRCARRSWPAATAARVSVVGVYGGFIDKFPMGAVMNRSLTIKTGQTHVQRYLRPLLERIENGEIDPSFVITHRAEPGRRPARVRDVPRQAGRLPEGHHEPLTGRTGRLGPGQPAGCGGSGKRRVAAVTCSHRPVSAVTCSTPPPSSMTDCTSSSSTSGGSAQRPAADRALLTLDGQVTVRVADRACLLGPLLHEQLPDGGDGGGPEAVAQPGDREPTGCGALQRLGHQPLLLGPLIALHDRLGPPADRPEVVLARMHGERPGHPLTHAPRQVGQELRDLVLVAADRDDVEPVAASLLVQPLGDGAVVPLGQLVGLVPAWCAPACPPRSRACAASGRAAERRTRPSRPRRGRITGPGRGPRPPPGSGGTRPARPAAAGPTPSRRSRSGPGSGAAARPPRTARAQNTRRTPPPAGAAAPDATASSMRATSPRSERRASRSSPESSVNSRTSCSCSFTRLGNARRLSGSNRAYRLSTGRPPPRIRRIRSTVSTCSITAHRRPPAARRARS